MQATLLWIFIALFTIIALLAVVLPLVAKARASWWVPLAIAVLFPSTAIYAYDELGSAKSWQQFSFLKDDAAKVKQEVVAMGGIPGVIRQLETRLKQQPYHPHGWFLLGKIYLEQNQSHKALACLMKSNKQKPNQPEVMTALAEAIFDENKQRLTKPAKNLLKASLKIAPNNIEAINLLAVNAYLTQHYQTAIHYWESMIPYFDPSSKDGKQLFSMIHQAQDKLAHKG